MKHPLAERAALITESVIGAAIEVHRDKGPGLLESIYQRCFVHELKLRGHSTEEQRTVQVRYKDLVFEDILRCDVIVDGCLLIELKSVAEILPVHKAQTISYIKLLDLPRGLLINFNVPQLIHGLNRVKHPAYE
ncbi:MAG: GxxExxY protein [Verrucomicrobiota bacterium]